MLSSTKVRGPAEAKETVAVGGGTVQWVLANSGEAPWPESTTLRLVGGPVLMRPIIEVPALQPGETVIIDLDVKAAAEPTSVFYTLVTPNCQPFGDIFAAVVVPQAWGPCLEPTCAVLSSPMDEPDRALEALQGELKTVEWALANVGAVAWPDDAVATLIYSTGGLEHLPLKVPIPRAQPGMTVHVGVQMLMPAAAGVFKALWKVESPTHPDFGEVLHAEFSVGDFPVMGWMGTASATEEDLDASKSDTSMRAGSPKSRPRSSARQVQRRANEQFTVDVCNRFAQLADEAAEAPLDAAAPPAAEPGRQGFNPVRQRSSSADPRPGKGKKEKQRAKEAEEACDRLFQEHLELFSEQRSAATRRTELGDQPPVPARSGEGSEHCESEAPLQGPVQEDQEATLSGASPTAEPAPPPLSASTSDAVDWQVGAAVEARNCDSQAWERGTVSGTDPLTVTVGHNLMAFEYLQVRPVCFDIGAEVEVRNGDAEKWEAATVASTVPLTVFLEDSTLAFGGYQQVRTKIIPDAAHASLLGRFRSVILVLLLAAASVFLGTGVVRPTPPRVQPGGSKGTELLADKILLSPAGGADETGGGDADGITIERMRELGHLQLSVSDCGGAEQWFSRAQALLGRTVAETSAALANESSPSSPWSAHFYAVLQSDHGFSLVCARRFQEGVAAMRRALPDATLSSLQPDFLNALGFAHFHLGEFGQAKEAFRAAVAGNPLNPVLWNNLAAAGLSTGDGVAAEGALQQALDLVGRLSPDAKSHYLQVFSNNFHLLHGHAAKPSVEIFHCMPRELSTLASTTSPGEFQSAFESAAAEVGAVGFLDASNLLDAHRSVLALRPEPVFCK